MDRGLDVIVIETGNGRRLFLGREFSETKRAGRAARRACWRELGGEAMRAEGALLHDSLASVELGRIIWAGPRAVFTPDAALGVDGNGTGHGMLVVGECGAVFLAGRVEAMVASKRKVELRKLGNTSLVERPHAPPAHALFELVLDLAGDGAGCNPCSGRA